MFNSLFGKKSPQKGGPLTFEPPTHRSPLSSSRSQAPSFSKVFRWRLPDGQTEEPQTVEIVGSFTKWERVSLTRDSTLDAWHVTLHNIPSHQTHHYMLLVDGKPAKDKNCDGLAPPHGANEERYTLATDRGPRVFMLFAQTK
ncbi:MAG TPA: hypothetical protein VG938_02845 [Verrucomicrobiae bacterium]|jgi:hypothetical protein|nr:hypothetical protein [Verrucomicrobiae bacterium]